MFSNFFVDNVKIRRELDCPYCQPSSLPVSGRSVWRRPHLHFPACFCSSWSRPPKPATFIRFLSLFLWNVSILSFLLSLLSSALRSCPLASFFLFLSFFFFFLGFQICSCYTSSQKALSWPERTIAGTTALSPVFHLSPRPSENLVLSQLPEYLSANNLYSLFSSVCVSTRT